MTVRAAAGRADRPVTVPGRASWATVRAALLVGAVGMAFADASVVALALPDLYAEFDTSIVGVSWVLTTYALVVAVTAVPVALVHRRVRPLALVVRGVAVFAAASLVAGLATSLAVLLVRPLRPGRRRHAPARRVAACARRASPASGRRAAVVGDWPAPSALLSARRSAAC